VSQLLYARPLRLECLEDRRLLSIFGPRNTVDGTYRGAQDVFGADMDGDGDLDILGAGEFFDGEITWWENDGSAGGWTEHLVNDNFGYHALSLHAADVDGDGDMDVLGGSTGGGFSHHIKCWINNGFGGGWSEYNVDAASWGEAPSVDAADFDGDGDIDVVGASGASVWWYENSSGSGTSWAPHLVEGTFYVARSVFAADIDGDGDTDILGAADTDDDIAWWENDGAGGGWIERRIDGSFDGANSVCAADLDGDGDQDVLGAAIYGDDIAWWENRNGVGTLWTKHAVDENFDGARSVCSADIDDDGHLDIVAAARESDEIVWWENGSHASAWTKHTVDSLFLGAWSVQAADVDGDGITDILGAALDGDDIAWWENLLVPDTTPPTVSYRDPVPGAMINTSSIRIDITLSEEVEGVDVTDLVCSGTAAVEATVGMATDLGANTWRFPIFGLVDGALDISLAPDPGDIKDTGGNDLPHVSWSYTVDGARPCDAPRLLKDIKALGASNPAHFIALGGTVFFVAEDASHGGELWKTDGTRAGTEMVKDIWPGSHSSEIAEMTISNGTLFFRANDGSHGPALWKSDGTEVGTVMVKDIDWAKWRTALADLTDVDGTLFFGATDGVTGSEIWKSDGTEAGTVRVSNIIPGDESTFIQNLINVNGTLFFTCKDESHGFELWKSDGTEAGTVMVKDIYAGLDNSSRPESLTNVNGSLFFSAYAPVMVKDMRPGTSSWEPENLTDFNGTLFFQADTVGGSSGGFWKSDGTEAGTVEVVSVGSVSPEHLTVIDDTLFFEGFDNELWKSDGTEAGTVEIKEIANATNLSGLTDVSGTLYFTTNESSSGWELWRSDGTAAGTTLFADIRAGTMGSGPGYLENADGTLFFSADDGVCAREPWVLDTAPVVRSIVRADPDPTTASSVDFTVTFTEDVDGVGTEDLVLMTTGAISGASVTAVSPSTGPATTYTVTVATGSGDGTIRLDVSDDDTIVDGAGNPLGCSGTGNGDYTAGELYTIDVNVTGYPVPLEAKGPLGGLIYDPSVSAMIGTAGDTDSFTIDLEDGQTITVVVDSDATLVPTIELFDPSSASIGSTNLTPPIGAPGEDAVLQLVETTHAGTYTITIGGANSTTGTYTAQMILNAAVEEEEHHGAANDDAASAQDLNASFITLAGGLAQRGAVLGTLQAGGGQNVVVDSEDFESGALDAQWTTYRSSTTYGRIRVTGDQGAAGGSKALLMDVNPSNHYSLNEAIWTVDLSGVTEATLGFCHAEWNDEQDTLSGDFVGHRNGDGVAISADGTIWHTIWNAVNQSSGVWQEYTFDLAARAGAHGISLGSNFQIKFQQYDNYRLTTDGRGYDEIVITAPAAAEDWYSFSLEDGQTTTLGIAADTPDNLTMELYDSSLTLLETATAATNLDQVINNFADATTNGVPDTYYVRIMNDSASEYSLVVTRDADFDTEANDSFATARDISGVGVALGYLDSGSGGGLDQADYYALSLEQGDQVQVNTQTPFDDLSKEPVNRLDPRLVIFDPSENQVASDDNSDGHNAQVTFTATTSGDYRIQVLAEAAHGEYLVNVEEALNQAPVADAGGPYAINEGDDLPLNASLSWDPDGDPLTFFWDVNGDGIFGDATGDQPTLTWAELNALGIIDDTGDGHRHVFVRVEDDKGAWAESPPADLSIDNTPPTITLHGNPSVDEGSAYTLTLGEVTDPGNDTVTDYIVHWGDGDSDMWPTPDPITHTYADGPDSPTITVHLVDEDGTHVGAGSLGVTVNNVAPSVAADGNPVTVEEGLMATNTGTYSDPGEDTVTVTASVGTIVDNSDGTWTWSFQTTDGPDESQLVTIRATDSDTAWTETTFQLTVNNVAPTIDTITGPDGPVSVGTAVSITVDFTDPGADEHAVVWAWGDGTDDTKYLTDGCRRSSYSHQYEAAGVYTVTVTVTDDDGDSDESVFQYVVVYDPNAGFVTGGGWIDSPLGAYVPDETLTGKASFGFVSKYKKGADTPTGQTQFQFKVADLNFHSTDYQWLVIAGANAKYKGSGTINGGGNYGFMLTATDGQVNGGGGTDKFRIKIWDKDQEDLIVYDNQPAEEDDSYAGTDLGGGSIVIHDGGNGLHAAGLASVGKIGAMLAQDLLAPVAEEAISYWTRQGVDSDSLAALSQVNVHVADLSGSVLGIASSSNLIWIDRDAAGYGWNVASTSSGVDLLSVVTHEFGHKLGLGHEDPHGVMAATLTPGVRTVDKAAWPEDGLIGFSWAYESVVNPLPAGREYSGARGTTMLDMPDLVRTTLPDGQAVRIRDRFFEGLAVEAGHAFPVENRRDGPYEDVHHKGRIGDLAGLLAEALADDGSAEEAEEELPGEVLAETLWLLP
jgi:ELWxxDGT repeat protein